MEYSPQQEAALLALGAWLKAPYDPTDQVRGLFGYAGTGKTTLLRALAAECPGQALFASYTGKASFVMRQKGCVGATTIHSLIYKPAGESKSDGLRDVERQIAALWAEPPESEEDKAERQRRELQLTAQRDSILMREGRKPMFTVNPDSPLRYAAALILDECSMVDERIGRDLESFGKKIICAGDPAQLPPVGGGGYFTDRRPDHMLTEVHRHAKESGILRLATDVRTTGSFSRVRGHYGADVTVMNREDKDALVKAVLDADQVLVGRNATRHAYNARYRSLTNREGVLPLAGDKVVCLRNNHEAGLLNGSLWRVHEAQGSTESMDVEMLISSDEDGASGIPVTSHAHHFMGREDELKKMQWNRRDKEEFDFGYNLTVHKSQGSQWGDVCLFDESGAFRSDAQRWLYTGVTRAADRLTVVV